MAGLGLQVLSCQSFSFKLFLADGLSTLFSAFCLQCLTPVFHISNVSDLHILLSLSNSEPKITSGIWCFTLLVTRFFWILYMLLYHWIYTHIFINSSKYVSSVCNFIISFIFIFSFPFYLFFDGDIRYIFGSYTSFKMVI